VWQVQLPVKKFIRIALAANLEAKNDNYKKGVWQSVRPPTKWMGGMVFRAPWKTLKAVSLLRMKTRRGKGKELAGEEIRILR
jgi:hypothetical protein